MYRFTALEQTNFDNLRKLEVCSMSEIESSLKERAKKMMLEGKSFDDIREETKLRLKDLKRIQHEINNNF